ncbi:hypothetical protein DEO72_LG9g1558 [Vigna unguiculata]|uniref:Secreted protein n=1 Tax=Vigna unguiculata TaxID=3917 RepID=A0A4D6N0Y8_VIGUN|nr:hypothetical protein DEO72_LG9g1558 [Vigna unguiculata]
MQNYHYKMLQVLLEALLLLLFGFQERLLSKGCRLGNLDQLQMMFVSLSQMRVLKVFMRYAKRDPNDPENAMLGTVAGTKTSLFCRT